MRITVIGAGNSGLAMSAHLSLCGEEVRLWNRSKSTVASLLETHVIHLHGVHEGPVQLHMVTTDIDQALDGTELILITTPANSHSNLAHALAGAMKESVPIVLNPGRTFGALNFRQEFLATGGSFEPDVAETQTIIYTCRKDGHDHVTIYSFKELVGLASLDSAHTQATIDALPLCIRNRFTPAQSFLETSLGNVGLVLHCLPFMLNVGWTECPTADYKYYYDGITPTIGSLIERVDTERLAVAEALGVNLESTAEWLKREYSIEGDSIHDLVRANDAYREIDAPKSVKHRYIYEDVPHGLVPIERLGRALGVLTPTTTVGIDLANALTGEEFRLHMPTVTLDAVKTALAMGSIGG